VGDFIEAINASETTQIMDTVVAKDEERSAKSEGLIRQRIGKKLNQVYADIVAEPVPDRFLELIEKLGAEPKQARSNDVE
jgi:hypothetical protein